MRINKHGPDWQELLWARGTPSQGGWGVEPGCAALGVPAPAAFAFSAQEVLSSALPCVSPKCWICRALQILECSSSAASPVAARLFIRAVFPCLLCGEQHPLARPSDFTRAERTRAASPRCISVQHLLGRAAVRDVRDSAGHYQAENEKPFLVPPSLVGSPRAAPAGAGDGSSAADRAAGSGGRHPPVSRSPLSDLSRPGPLPLRQHVPAPCRRGRCQTGAAPAAPGRRPPGSALRTALATAERRGISISIMSPEWHPSVPLELGPGVCLLSEEVWQPIH